MFEVEGHGVEPRTPKNVTLSSVVPPRVDPEVTSWSLVVNLAPAACDTGHAGFGPTGGRLRCRAVSHQDSVTLPDGLEVAYLRDGDDGPLALCLHGFPDSAFTWRHLLPELAAAGYRAVAPWLRGYAPTAVPADGHYQNGALVRDAIGLHEALGGDGDAVVIGHDWGARAANGAAAFAPERFRRVVTMAVPPAGAVAEGFLSFRQLKRSWYMFFFQHPLADIAVQLEDLSFIDRLWEDWSPGYTESADDRAGVKAALADPANLAAALGYYRATLQPDLQTPDLAAEEAAVGANPPQPHLYLHGVDDGCMGVEIAERASVHLTSPGSRAELVPGTGHFLHLEAPDVVNRHILGFLAEP
jgi:pimeloyl-ACP methyl ester carboxylesterase